MNESAIQLIANSPNGAGVWVCVSFVDSSVLKCKSGGYVYTVFASNNEDKSDGKRRSQQ